MRLVVQQGGDLFDVLHLLTHLLNEHLHVNRYFGEF